jgi:hypothetical protein
VATAAPGLKVPTLTGWPVVGSLCTLEPRRPALVRWARHEGIVRERIATCRRVSKPTVQEKHACLLR